MTGLRRAVIALRHAGCRSVLVDGSFVTSKELPGDYDMAFDPNGMESARLDPLLLRHDDGRKAMKAKYLGDIFPSGAVASATTGAVYTQFFQHDRSGMPKGIVELFPGELT